MASCCQTNLEICIWTLTSFFIFSKLHVVQGDSLRLVHVVHRHGDRSPTRTYPNDIYKEQDWPQGYGQLSKLGIQQMFELGQFLRQRYMLEYSNLLNETYINKEIYVRSSDTDRGLMSASSMLAGLYRPHGGQVWNSSVLWQPIPVHTVALKHDQLLSTKTADECPRYQRLFEAVKKSQEVQQMLSQDKALYEEVIRLAGYDRFDVQNLWYLQDILMTQKESNRSLPAWVTPQIYNKLDKLKTLEFKCWSYTPEMARIRVGILLGTILNHTDDKISGRLATKFFSYSSHDSLLSALAFGLKIWENVKPTYANSYMIELHEPSYKNYTVKVFFRNETTKPPYLMKMPGCGAECSIADFRQLIQENVLSSEDEWQQACEDSTKAQSHHSLAVVISVFVVVIIVVAVVVAIVCYRRRTSGINYMPANFNSVKS